MEKTSKPNLSSLAPKSVAKVFLTVNAFSNLDLPKLKDVNDLKNILSHSYYTIAEKYFILYYLKKYLNYKYSHSFISLQIKERISISNREYIEDIGEMENFTEWVTVTKKHIDQITDYIDGNISQLERQLNNSNIDPENNYYKDLFEYEAYQIIRPPLTINGFGNQDSLTLKDTTAFITKSLSNILNQDDINVVIKNFFGKSQAPPQLLNLNYKDLGNLRIAFYNIYKFYKKEADNLKDFANSELTKLKHKELDENYTLRDFYIQYFELPNEDHVNAMTNKLNFARMIFVSFPQLRKKFISKSLKTNITLDYFIKENIMKNMKKT